MTRMWAVVGDTTSSGGQVITGSPFTDIDGKPVARINDKATCPKHQGTFPIVDGDPTTIIDGEAVALHGSSLACGCRVLAVQQVRVLLDAGGGGGGGSSGVSGGPKAAAADPGAMAGPIASLAFDEQIRFVGPTGVPLSNLGYRLHLADGSTAEGVTDADGRTERVATVQAVGFYSAELLPPAGAQGCCAASALPAQSVPVALNGAATNASAVGSSTHKVATKDEDRDLTSGEVAMLSQVFGSSVDYSAVKLHNHGYWMLFGFQPDNTATAPNGEIYMPADLFSPDFSRELNERQHLLVHEITHVWQYQLGYPVKRVRAPRPNMSYEYLFTQGRKLCDYNMEAQGNLIADYFLVKFRNDPLNISEFRYSRMPGLMAEYERALSDFIADPSNPENLPKVTE